MSARQKQDQRRRQYKQVTGKKSILLIERAKRREETKLSVFFSFVVVFSNLLMYLFSNHD
jgi:hypothetical protein